MDLLLLGLLSLALGASFVASGFGFSGAWRQLLEQGKTYGTRLQLILLALLVMMLYPLIDEHSLLHQPIQPFVRPLSLSVVFGGLVFGIGMQLAASCTSGSLGNAGRGHWNGWLALVMMIVGATLAAYHFDWWQAQASWLPFSWVEHLGWQGGLLTALLLLALAYGLLLYVEYRRYGQIAPIELNSVALLGVVLIAVLLMLLTLLQGHPWGVTLPFATIGIQAMDMLGWQGWTFWGFSAEYAHMIEKPFWQEPMTLTLMGFIVGAAIAQIVLKKTGCNELIKPALTGRRNQLLTIVGGLMMGYAGIIGFGCNIGAFVSGVSSASLHALLWLVFALWGNWLGLKLRNKAIKPVS
jgi:uncharacterized membrane protein YedE/YeeE